MRNFANRRLFKRNYFVVSEDGKFSEKINSEKISEIKKTRKYEFTYTFDCYDHKIILPCKVVVEEIDTNKTYFDLFS